jgi:hypothetical protein
MAVSKPRPRRKKRRIFHRRKVCRFCADQSLKIDYKDPRALSISQPNEARSFLGEFRVPAPSTSGH